MAGGGGGEGGGAETKRLNDIRSGRILDPALTGGQSISRDQIQQWINDGQLQGNINFGNLQQAGAWGANQAASMLNGAPDLSGQWQGAYNTANNAIQGLQNFNAANPYQSNFSAMGGQANPFMSAFQQYGGNNPYFDQTVDRAMDSVQDRVNSQFGLAGRNGSGMHVRNMTEGLGNVANQMYSDNYQNNMNRGLQATGMASNAYNQNFGNQLNAFQAGANAYNQSQGMNLNALQSQMSGAGMMADLANAQQDAYWSPINNYSQIIAQLSGTQPAPRNKASSFDRAIGLGTMLGGLL